MKIVLACDHAGFALKEIILQLLEQTGYEVLDVGTYSEERVDFPDFTAKACRAIQEETAERGIIICGSGIGACIAANKFRGIYASICHDTYSAHQGVEHDNMNVLCLGGRVVGEELAKEIVIAFLKARFSNEERFKRRQEKIIRFEREAN
jgi:RpiB/LacA/LacB family sugar-phosphate isomerase